MTKTKRRKNQ